MKYVTCNITSYVPHTFAIIIFLTTKLRTKKITIPYSPEQRFIAQHFFTELKSQVIQLNFLPSLQYFEVILNSWSDDQDSVFATH